jgi:hypothetical protein
MLNQNTKLTLILKATTALLFFCSCTEEFESSAIVYQNDFESGELNQIEGGIINSFNATNVIGFYNNDGFVVSLSNLPEHEYLVVSMDLYIHDSWDGNIIGVDGPDFWNIQLDDWENYESELAQNLQFKTTFSNTACNSSLCLLQSFPNYYNSLNSTNNPKTGALPDSLPGRCHLQDTQGTYLYRIEELFPHKEDNGRLRIIDQLVQTNSNDPLCDESWSADNLVIKTIKTK